MPVCCITVYVKTDETVTLIVACPGGEGDLRQRRSTPTLEEALQMVLGRTQPPFAVVTNSSSSSSVSQTPTTTPSVGPRQFSWSPMFMSPGSQNPLHLNRHSTKQTSAPPARARWQDREAELRDDSLTSFVQSRGLFEQTLTNHQQTMASQHQMALHEIGSAFNRACEKNPDAAAVSENANMGAVLENGISSMVSGATEKSSMANSAGIVSQNTSSGVVENASLRGRISPDSIMSMDSLSAVASVPRQGRPLDVRNTQPTTSPTANLNQNAAVSSEQGTEVIGNLPESRRSPTVTGNADTSGSSVSCGRESASPPVVEKSGCAQKGGNVPMSGVGGVRLDSRLWEGIHPVTQSNGTHPVDNGQRGGASGVEADTQNVVERNDRAVKNGSAVEGCGPSTGSNQSSFFLHRNTSPNIAVVQPSVHPVLPDQNPNNHSTQPTVVVPASRVDCLQRDRNISSCTDNKAYPAGNVGENQQPVVSFVSVASTALHAPRTLNTMTVLPPDKDDVGVSPKQPETYRLSSCGQAATPSGTIFAIPPSFVTDSQLAEFRNCNSSMSGFPSDKPPTLDFPTAMCIKDEITYEEIPVDDTSSVSSIMSDVAAATRSVAPGKQ